MGEDQKRSVEIDEFMSRIDSGAVAGAAKAYLNDYIYGRIWKVVTLIANSTNNELLGEYKGELRSLMLLAQKFSVDIVDAQIATEQLRKAYEAKPSMTQRR